MDSKKKLVAARAFKDKNGKDYKPGDKIEVDEAYGQELVQRGDAKDEGQASQQPADKK
jgi:hypothetical protein